MEVVPIEIPETCIKGCMNRCQRRYADSDEMETKSLLRFSDKEEEKTGLRIKRKQPHSQHWPRFKLVELNSVMTKYAIS